MVAKRATSGGTYAQIYQIDLRASELKRRVKCGDIEGQVVLDALEALLKPLRNPHAHETVELTPETTLASISLHAKATNITSLQVSALRKFSRIPWIEFLGDFAYTSEAFLRDQRNIGPGIINALAELLSQCGVEIGSRMEHPEDPDVILHEVYGSLPFRRLLEVKLNSDWIYGYEQKHAAVHLMNQGIETFGEMIPLTEDEISGIIVGDFLTGRAPEELGPEQHDHIIRQSAYDAKKLYSALHDPMPGLYEKLEDQIH